MKKILAAWRATAMTPEIVTHDKIYTGRNVVSAEHGEEPEVFARRTTILHPQPRPLLQRIRMMMLGGTE